MINYKALDLDKKGQIPTYKALMPIVLTIFEQQDCDCRVDDIQHIIQKEYFKLPPRLAELKIKHGDTVIHDRIYFSCFQLRKIHFLSLPYQSTFRLTSKANRFWRNYSHDYKSLYKRLCKLDKEMEKKTHKKKRRKESHKKAIKTSSSTPMLNFPERVGKSVSDYNEGLKSRILRAILDKHDPFFFEHLVVKLLSKMGYKGKHGRAITTKKTGDHGIDGVIDQDPLGTRTVYIQAKCYAPTDKVGEPEIQQFSGAMSHYKASCGVFITTSSFTKEAQADADDRTNIVTVDGHKLAKLMLEYHVGVQIQNTYQILKIDNDFFE